MQADGRGKLGGEGGMAKICTMLMQEIVRSIQKNFRERWIVETFLYDILKTI
jgi:hypothetical protein